MEKETYKYYKALAQIQNVISVCETPEDAIKAGIKIVMQQSAADAVTVWYQNQEDGVIYPYYWIGPIDLTVKKVDDRAALLYQILERTQPLTIGDFQANPDAGMQALYEDMQINSVIEVPFGRDKNTGVAEFLRTGDHAAFTDEESDLCQMLLVLVEILVQNKNWVVNVPPKGNVILSARGVTKDFENGGIITHTLKGVNMDVVEGEFTVILGESGCGKSTFLNIVAGMDKLTDGEFSFMGKPMQDATFDELTKYRRDNIGFIFQQYNLMPNLTAKENLDLIAELVEDPMDSMEALKLVGLEERAKNYPSQLSGGQQQRVSIARSIIKKPKLIFADEPTAALDYTTSIEVLHVLEEIVRKNRTTLLMVTHNEEITKMADRVIRIRDGRTYEVSINPLPCHAEDLVW